MKYSILLIILFSTGLMARGQEVPEISEKDISVFSLLRNETFIGGSLWGYMNGGADIYLEYGFDILRVEEFSRDDEIIKLELFKMDDPIAAFGIYSIKTFKCKQQEVLTTIDCLNNFQFQLLYGDHYIQLSNESGTEKAQQFMIDLAYVILQKLEPTELILPVRYLTDSLNIPFFNIKMIKGELGIQDKAYELAEYFSGIADYQVYFSKAEKDGEDVKYYEIIFNDPDMKVEFLGKIKDNMFQILREGNTSILGVSSR